MIIVCQSLGSRPILVLELFTLVPRLFETTYRCLSVQPVQLLPSRNIWRHISLTWPFPHRYRHSPWPVDVMELFPRFCCWTLIWLSRQWAWLRRGYWRYRSLIDWLIGWLKCKNIWGACSSTSVFFWLLLPTAVACFRRQRQTSKVSTTVHINEKTGDLKVEHCVYIRPPHHVLITAVSSP